MKSLSEILAQHIANFSELNIPEEVSLKCKQLLVDTYGVIAFGSSTPWSKMILEYFSMIGGAPEASTIAPRISMPAASAAFVNGTMAHSFDYDDDLAACHIACSVIPAALAVGQKERIPGTRLIGAITVGYDIAVRLAETLDGHHLYSMGYHPTPVCGVFGAAAAASYALRLSPEKAANSLGIAGSFPSGSLEWLKDGAMTKRFHGGKAASEGVLSAALAQRGFTGPTQIFEGESGIFKMFSAQREPSMLISELGQRFDVIKSYTKLYPCCTCNAPVVDAVIDIRQENIFSADDITEIEIGLRKTCMNLVGVPLEAKQKPNTVLEAQMSAPFCAAAALIEGELFPPQFQEANLSNPQILKLAAKARAVWKEELEVAASPRPVPATVRIKLRDGRMFQKRVDYQKGTFRNPLKRQEINRKFSICTKGIISNAEQKHITDRIYSLEKIDNINELFGK